MTDFDLTILISPWSEMKKNLRGCKRLQTYAKYISDEPWYPKPKSGKYHLDTLLLNETRFFNVIDPVRQTSIRGSAHNIKKTRDMDFTCHAVPGGYEVTRIK